MALHEESERRALEGELALLEKAWREAEEIAPIADAMFVPEDVAVARLEGFRAGEGPETTSDVSYRSLSFSSRDLQDEIRARRRCRASRCPGTGDSSRGASQFRFQCRRTYCSRCLFVSATVRSAASAATPRSWIARRTNSAFCA